MSSVHAIPLLLSALIGLLLGLVAWGFFQVWSHQNGDALMGGHDGVLLGLLVLAALALGVFLTYVLLSAF